MGCYGQDMIGPALNENPALPTANGLREMLAGGEKTLAAAVPVLRHLLGAGDPAMFCDAALAQVRGMLGDLARHLLAARAEAADLRDAPEFIEANERALTGMLAAEDALLAHVHALALEKIMAERLQAAVALDPVVSALVQDCIGADNDEVAGLAMEALAAQARFGQQQQRMELPSQELPDDLFLQAVLAMRAHAGAGDIDAQNAEGLLRDRRRGRPARLTLIDDLLAEGDIDVASRLSVSHAGLAIFLSALALASGQERATLVLSLFARESLFPALAMRAAGLEPEQVERQLAVLGAEPFAGGDLADISSAEAAMLLARRSAGGE